MKEKGTLSSRQPDREMIRSRQRLRLSRLGVDGRFDSALGHHQSDQHPDRSGGRERHQRRWPTPERRRAGTSPMTVTGRTYVDAMGKNNRARRAAKTKRRADRRRRASTRGHGSGRDRSEQLRAEPRLPPLTDQQRASQLWSALAWDDLKGDQHRTVLMILDELDPAAVRSSAERLLMSRVTTCWEGGWQPVELARQVRRTTSSAAAQLARWAIAVDDAPRRASTIDARWQAQLDALGLPSVDGGGGWITAWSLAEGVDGEAALSTVADLLRVTTRIPRLDVLLPPPGSADVQRVAPPNRTGGRADPVLEKVRALLNKAESTDFEAEAAAFTAKAQQLMTRHAIDAAMLARGSGSGVDEPAAVRVLIDAPYVDAKSLLLQVVANAGRCCAAMHKGLDMSTVMGVPDDLANVETLFTSLLVQAQSALAEAARSAPAGTRVRSQSFRSAFLVGFANRIGDIPTESRAAALEAINKHVAESAEEELGSDVALVLRDRLEAVHDAFDARFGRLTQSGVRGGHDLAGYQRGRFAADLAELNLDLTDRNEHGTHPVLAAESVTSDAEPRQNGNPRR